MNKITRIEELKAFIYGVKLTGVQQGVTINLSYVDSTEMSQQIYIHYNKHNEDEYKASNVAERLIKTNREALKLVIELTEENDKLRKELDKLEKEFLDALRGL